MKIKIGILMKNILKKFVYILIVFPLINLIHFEIKVILKRVNLSVWFGYGNFYNNNIEGL